MPAYRNTLLALDGWLARIQVQRLRAAPSNLEKALKFERGLIEIFLGLRDEVVHQVVVPSCAASVAAGPDAANPANNRVMGSEHANGVVLEWIKTPDWH